MRQQLRPITRGGLAEFFFEDAIEMGERLEADLERNFA